MKKILTLLLALPFFYTASGQTNFEFIGSEIEPLTGGFYKDGLTFDFDGNGSPEFEKGCPSADVDPEDYERRDPFNVIYDAHNESGTQDGWSFKNVMILPDCDHKYINDAEPIDPLVSHGFVQIRPLLDTSDVDLAPSYILSPLVRNVQSITIETSADISIIADTRYIPYVIEYSLDSGLTFVQQYYITDEVDVRSGNRETYDEEEPNFAQMMADSEDENIMIRVTTNLDDPNLEEFKGQYVNIHKITIVADSAAEESTETVLQASRPKPSPSSIRVENGKVFVAKGTVSVFSLSGRLMGSGSNVSLRPGLYVAITDRGERQKILIRPYFE